MYRAGDAVERPLHGPAPPRMRSVEVARGRAGYGFTLSGQAPCVLSCVMRGSPADFVGLRAGDQILAVNEINVKKASHEDVVKLIGKCSGVLHMVIGEGVGHVESCSSDEEVGFYEGKGWLKPKLDSKASGISRAERVVEEVRSGGIFSMIFENPSLRASTSEPLKLKQRSLSESAAARFDLGRESVSHPNPSLLSKEEIPKVIHDDSVFSIGPENHEDFALDASILNVAMVVGYLGSIELPSTSCNLESDSLQAIRGCLRRLRAEQKIHSLVTMRVLHDRVQLCTDQAAILAEYPAEKLAFSAVCPDDRRLFGLVTMQSSDDGSLAHEEEGALRTSCHVFMVDPDLFNHKIHQGIARRFGFECTADPDTNGCLEFPVSSLPVLQFISVLYRDMGELIEGVRARAFVDGDADAHQNTSTSSNSDSGIGNFHQEERSSRVLVVDLGASSSRHGPSNGGWEGAGGRGSQPWAAPWNGAFCHDAEGGPPFEAAPQADRCRDLSKHLGPAAHAEVPAASLRSSVPPSKRGAAGHGGGFGQRWLPVHVLQEWQCGHASDQESYTDSTDGWSSVNCGTLPPPMSKIPADRYRVGGSLVQPPLSTQRRDWSRKAFGMQNIFGPHRQVRKTKEDKKGSKLGRGIGLTQTSQRTSARRSFGRSKRFSITRSLDDLESATVSDGELTGADLKDCVSHHSLSSNASLPSVQSCRRLRERRAASWAVSFERLLQDPLGVRYFSDFLRKEFSEENILFWQACEYFNHVPAHDKKELSYRAREIFSKFLCSKATTPVNIDSQAQLADDILSAPHPDMFKEQQLQIFNLMKFDSYTRFLKSQLYQECILAEVEGRSLPDALQAPSSPASKHSVSSEHSSVSTPKKLSGKSKSGRSLNEELGDEESEKKRKGAFFSWSRTRSTGRSQRKKEHGDPTNEWREGAPGPWRPHIKSGWAAGHLGGERALQRESIHRETEKCTSQTECSCKFQFQKSLGYEFFELISKAQSNRADDQRGLLRKEDLVLPEFLRLPPSPVELALPSPTAAKSFGKRSLTSNGKEKPPRPPESWGPTRHCRESPATSPSSADSLPFSAPQTPSPNSQEAEAGGVQTMEGEHVADLTLTGEGDISSPNSTLLPPTPTLQDSAGPPRPGGRARGSQGLPVNTIIDVDCVAGLAPGLGSSVPGVRTGPQRSRASGPLTADLTGLSPVPGGPAKPKASPHHATFV
ncbi:regulator of G-protein signaling 12 isoform X2 [Zalophus californianus]|uniref:Regulator of G-protein signaling 12 isoform X2 n=1 Tax=Zalophus californianus TaxID=9704 RepID=A0A6P9F7L3_ZALCA|nr:regulator of G-protein signaling 12 isoform X2 [Zalophus californianus]